MMTNPRRWRGWLLLAALLAVPTAPATAQLVRLAQGAGEVGVESRGERTAYGDRRGSAMALFDEWFAVPISGVVLGPRFFSYTAMLRPVWGQQRAYGQADEDATRNVVKSFAANLLPAAPVSLTVQSNRASGSAQTGFGGETSFQSEGFGGTLRTRSAAFPIFAEWSTRAVNDLWRGAADQVPLHRDETLQSFRVTGQSSKLNVTVARSRFIDRVGTLAYASTDATATHSLRWGKESVLETMADGSDREGSDAHRRRSLGERLHLQHTTRLSTDWAMQLRGSNEKDTPSKSRAASIGARYQPWRMLSTSLLGSGTSSTFGRGSLASLAVTPSVLIRVGLPAGTRFEGALNGGYERSSREMGDDTWIRATDEVHFVDDTRRFLLLHEAGDLVSLVLSNREHSVEYVRGLDYRASMLGELIVVDLLPAGRLTAGDAVAATYRYALPQAAEHELRQLSANVALTRDGFRFRESVSLRRGRALSGGADDNLGSGDDYVTSLGTHLDGAIGRIDASAEYRTRLHSRTDFTTAEARLGLLPPAVAGVQGNVSTAFMRTQMNGQEAAIVTSNGALSWSPMASLRTQASVEHWLWSPRDQRRERFVGYAMDAAWTIGQLQTDWRYAYQRREAAAVGAQHRFSARMMRRF